MFASPGLYALAGLLQWHLELRLNALTGSLLVLLVGLFFTNGGKSLCLVGQEWGRLNLLFRRNPDHFPVISIGQ
jgi:hypothetical protein